MSNHEITVLAVIGGDARSAYLSQLLRKDGFAVCTFALEKAAPVDGVAHMATVESAARGAAAVVLPVPLTRGVQMLNAPLSDGVFRLRDIFASLRTGTLLLAGGVADVDHACAEGMGLKLTDYLKRDTLALKNAVPTAEGAIAVAMQALPVTLHGARCLVTGDGKVASILAAKLHAMQAHVTVAARRESDLARCYAAGIESMHIAALGAQAGTFDVIFNTVPAVLFSEEVLKHVRRDTPLIELASAPGGVDRTAAARLGIELIDAQSLPGRVAPLSAAEAIRDTIYTILREEGILIC